MDTHGFASLAHLQILLVPKYVAEIRSFESLRLGDIPVDSKNERARFMPNPLSTGHLHLSFPTRPPPTLHDSLALIRPSQFPLAVIGLALCSPTDTLTSILAQFNGALLDLFPPGALYPLARNCFVFEDGDGNNSSNLNEIVQGLVVIPSMMGNKKLYLGTLIADLCSNVLGEFGVLVQTLESPLGNEYLNASLFPILPPLSELPTPLDSNINGSPMPSFPTHNSVPDMSKSGFASSSVPPMKRTSSTGHRQSTLGPPAPRKRFSSIGVASSHGRLFKVLGDFYTIAGRIEDASIWYAEALQMFKTSHDPVWHASALEGIATLSVLEAWAAGHGLQTSTSNAATRDPWADVSDKLSQAATLYFKAPPSDADHHFSLLSYLYCCCVLRHSSLLFSIWSAKGWGPLAFTSMLQPGTTPYLPPTITREDHNNWSVLERLSSFSGVSRQSISNVLTQIHGPWLLHLGPRERVSILEAMASTYACLGYRRKEAYILREILGCVLDLIVCGREEDGRTRVSTSGDGSATPNGHNDVLNNSAQVGMRMNESTDGNNSVLNLLNYVCRTLGIDLEAVKILDVGQTTPRSDDLGLDDDVREPFGWPELQVGVVREAIAVAEALPDFLCVAQFALSSLKTLQDVLAPGDQYHLYTTATRALLTARRRGEQKTIEFWSSNPLVSIVVIPLPLIRLPNEKPTSALRPKSTDLNPILTGGTDPFLYNPRRVIGGKSQIMVVQNETVEVVVVLKNPYVFDFDIDSFTLSTNGPFFEAASMKFTIPARSYHRVVVSGKVTSTGILIIRGCLVEASGGTREFLLPLSSPEEEERQSRRRGALQCEVGRSKYPGLTALPWEKSQKRLSTEVVSKAVLKAPTQFLECKVVPEQPLLRIRRTSVTHGALMLYDGEHSVIRLTVENVSSMTIDFLRLVFDDSTIQPAQQTLLEGSLSTFDTYETEYDLIHRPLFSWNQNEVHPIAPGERLTLNVQCLGKVGCTNGTIYATYACVDRGLEVTPDVFHTRQLSYPLMVTVYRMLECQSMDIHPYPSNAVGSPSIHDHADWCLFSVEVRNSYGAPFEVTIERTQEGEPPASTSSTLAPGSTSRSVMALKKFILSDKHLAQPIPTLSDRQFVVATTKLSDEQDQTQRELFWYREELFKCLRCHWKEAGGTRSGDLSLRQQRMTMQMLNAIRTSAAKLVMSLLSDTDEELKHEIGRFYPPPHEFLYLRIQIINQTPSPLTLRLNVEFEPSEHILYEGVLTGIPVGRLQSEEVHIVSIPLCFLSYGRFTLSATVFSIGENLSEGSNHLTAVVLGG
ncbi:TRAPP II complex [Mucidula mucida]|nr:TRAPP II complex [Mucidula mucida]